MEWNITNCFVINIYIGLFVEKCNVIILSLLVIPISKVEADAKH